MSKEMTTRPVWFGPEDRPLFGHLHLGAGGRHRGGVLLCPPLGIESVAAGYAFRTLADQLAGAGFFALRFDYDGTGDSAGHQHEPDRVPAWLVSIRNGATFLKGLDPHRMSVIGMRMGATLVVEAFDSEVPSVDDLVLWDPCASGRRFLREQSALGSFTGSARANNDDGSIDTPGLVFDEETVTELSRMAIGDTAGRLANGILLLTRTGRKDDRSMRERLNMPHVDHRTISGQEDLVDVEPGYAIVLDETLDLIVNWLTERSDSFSENVLEGRTAGRPQGIVGRTKDGAAIVEKAQSIGSHGLFCITTSRHASIASSDVCPEESASDRAHSSPPTVVFLNAGVLDHVGPARLWVELSRTWAEAGLRVVRLDLTGIGESAVLHSRPQDFVYAPNAIDEIVEVLCELSPDDPSNAVLVGLCSGAYHAIEGAMAGHTRGVCLVNPDLTFTPPEVRVDAPVALQTGKLDRRRQAVGAKKDWTRVLPSARGVLGPLAQRLPDSAWWILNRVAVKSPPGRTFSTLIGSHSRILVIAGENEARRLRRGEKSRLRRLQRTGLFELDVVPDLEHSLFERESRQVASDLLTRHILTYYCRGTAVDDRR